CRSPCNHYHADRFYYVNGEPMRWLKARLSKAKNWLVETWKAALIVVGVVLVPLVLWKVPERQVRYLRQSDISRLEPKDRIQFEKDVVAAENSARVTLAQILGGFALLVGLYFTYKNIKVAEEGKLTERFSKAVELLGSEKLDVRLGGIYALERIARDSLKDHWTVMEVLTAFVREQSRKEYGEWERFVENYEIHSLNKLPPSIAPEYKYPVDIQAALTVIGRRKWVEKEKPHQIIDLSHAFLATTSLSRMNFSRANFAGANLFRVSGVGINLS